MAVTIHPLAVVQPGAELGADVTIGPFCVVGPDVRLGDRVAISSDTLIYPVLNGFGVKKGNTEVKTALEQALKKYSATPEYAALLKKYHFQAPTAEDLQTLMPKAE